MVMDKRVKSILPKPSQSPQTSLPVAALDRKRKASLVELATTRMGAQSPPIPSNLLDSYVEVKTEDKAYSSGSAPKKVRPVTSCTFCRQHKIKCDASQNYNNVCLRCMKLGLKCEIDPEFKPKKGSQIQVLIGDVEDLKAKIELLTRNEHLLTQALNQHNMNFMQQQAMAATAATASSQQLQLQQLNFNSPFPLPYAPNRTPSHTLDMLGPVQTPNFAGNHSAFSPLVGTPMNMIDNPAKSAVTGLRPGLAVASSDTAPSGHMSDTKLRDEETPEAMQPNLKQYSEFVLGDVQIPLQKADQLHYVFMTKFNPFLPILSSNSATELYNNSQLLFWTVILTASLSEPAPTLYQSLASLIKQLAIETCWIRTPRSAHVIQALIILSMWPLPNEKVLDDCSYRFVGLAKNLSLQLGLHRGGEFIQEFSRTQASLGPDSDLWRTRSWLAVFFCDHFWSSALGLPPSIKTTDYLLENARVDDGLPSSFRSLISLSIFQCKLVNVMGISVTRSDGLLEPLNRAASLNILDRELERLKFKLSVPDGSAVEVYYLYLRLMICCFAFLPGTPIEDQVKYVSAAYISATRIITIVSQILNVGSISLIELPIFVRQSVTYSAFLLFKLQLTNYLLDKYIDSARQSIVTVHRLFRNTLSSWKDLKNDISRTARVLEDLNIVLYTYPEIFNLSDSPNITGSIISRMRSHLTASLFYDLVWCIHEARRRNQEDKSDQNYPDRVSVKKEDVGGMRPQPLPFYNQITKDDFNTIITTTPNGTTVTTLVPTDQALLQAQKQSQNSNNKPLEINGIPLSMLEATGSIRDLNNANIGSTNMADSSLNVLKAQIPVDMVGAASEASQLAPTPYYSGNENDPMQMGTISEQGGMGSGMGNGMGTGIASQLDTFFQQQSHGWMVNSNNDDDFLGWIDMKMVQENNNQ